MKDRVSLSQPPFIKHTDCIKTIMLDILIALIPAMVWAVVVFGMRVISIALVSVASCVVFEYFYQRLTKKRVTVSDLSSVVIGVLLAFCLPVTVSLWIPAAGGFIAVVLVKQFLGGMGKNIINPVLTARVLLTAIWPNELNNYVQPLSENVDAFSVNVVDAVSAATPLAPLKAGVATGINTADLFMGNMGGCIGEISAVMLLLGGAWLIYRRVITWHIPASFLGTVAFLGFLFPQSQSVQAFEFMLMELFSGGLMLGAIFIATEFSSSPVTSNGRIIYGIGCGVLTLCIRFFLPVGEGVAIAILIMNLLSRYIDKFTRPKPFGYNPKEKQKKI